VARVSRIELPFADWPEEDRKRWSDAVRSGADPFDDCGPAAHLAESSRRALQGSYGRFLGFVSTERNGLLDCKPDARVDRETIAEYVTWRRRACGDTAIAIDLHHLRLALGYICPSMDWSWLLTIAKRHTTQAPRKHERRHQVTSEQLYALGIELMSYRRILVTEGSGGSGLSFRSDDLDSVGELYPEDDFGQLVVPVEAPPMFLGGLGELEYHSERSLVRKASLGAHGAVTHGRERAFDDVGRAQMFPVLGREVVEGQ